MKVRDVYLTCVVLAVGCASPPAVSSAPEPQPAVEEDAPAQPQVEPSVPYPADTFGVVWRDAGFYRDVDDPEPLQVFDFGDRPRTSRPGEGFTVRLLERRGDWHRVGTVTSWVDGENRDVHCVIGGVVRSADLELVFWVRARDFMPVLRRPVERRFEDGGHVLVEAGTPVVDGRPWMGGYWLPIDVNANDVGVSYVPQRTPVRDALADHKLFIGLLPEPKLGFDGHSAPWTGSELGPELHQFRERDDAKFLVWDRCGVAEFRAPDDAEPIALAGGVLGSLGGVVEERPAGSIEAGTRLFWPDGSRAGVAVQDTVRPDLLPSDDSMTCFELPLGYGTAKGNGFLRNRATVCVETNQIHRTTYVGSWNDKARRPEEAPDLFDGFPRQ